MREGTAKSSAVFWIPLLHGRFYRFGILTSSRFQFLPETDPSGKKTPTSFPLRRSLDDIGRKQRY